MLIIFLNWFVFLCGIIYLKRSQFNERKLFRNPNHLDSLEEKVSNHLQRRIIDLQKYLLLIPPLENFKNLSYDASIEIQEKIRDTEILIQDIIDIVERTSNPLNLTERSFDKFLKAIAPK